MKLIPNNVDIMEQFRIRNEFMEMVDSWLIDKYPGEILSDDLLPGELLNASGVRCHLVKNNANRVLAGFEIVDKKRYAWWLLKWKIS
jgi:hypothetical protein